METTIRLKPSELNDALFELVKNLVKTRGIKDITINLSDAKQKSVLRKESSAQVKARIEKAVQEIKSGNDNVISFTAGEFEKLSQSLLRK